MIKLLECHGSSYLGKPGHYVLQSLIPKEQLSSMKLIENFLDNSNSVLGSKDHI